MAEIKDMTVGQVLDTEVFARYMADVIESLLYARQCGHKHYRTSLKAHPIDRLVKRGEFTVEALTRHYADALNRQSTLSHAERRFVLEVGREVYVKTVQQFLNEKNT